MLQFSLCLFCSAVPLRERPICRHCLLELEKLYLPMDQVCTTEWGFPLLSLFDWRDDKLALPRLVMALKQGARAKLWDFLADIFVDQLGSFQVYLKQPLFVPIPSRLGITQDHAYLWAQALSFRLGEEVGERTYRQERAKIQFGSPKPLGNSFRTVILVDDLVASGATMQAAIAAFSEQKEVFGLSLVRRSLLLEQPPFDITRQ